MVTATITSKGQITIPKSVRDSRRLHTGDRVAFVVHDPGEAILKPFARTVDEIFGLLHKPGRPFRSVEDMDKAIRARLKKAVS